MCGNLGEEQPGRENRKCKGHGAGMCLACSRETKRGGSVPAAVTSMTEREIAEEARDMPTVPDWAGLLHCTPVRNGFCLSDLEPKEVTSRGISDLHFARIT